VRTHGPSDLVVRERPVSPASTLRLGAIYDRLEECECPMGLEECDRNLLNCE